VGTFWFGRKKSFLGGNILHLSKNETPSSFVKYLDLLSGTSVSSKVGLILIRNIFNCFNFYSIDIQDGFWYDVRLSVHMMLSI